MHAARSTGAAPRGRPGGDRRGALRDAGNAALAGANAAQRADLGRELRFAGDPAKNLGLSNVIGSIAVGKKADLLVIGGDAAAPYDALLQAEPSTVRLVMVGGRTLYGDSALGALAPVGPACEALPVCGANKFVCVAENGGTASNKLGQSLADIVDALSTELQSYDDQNLTSWDFSPIAPLVKCAPSGA